MDYISLSEISKCNDQKKLILGLKCTKCAFIWGFWKSVQFALFCWKAFIETELKI